MTLDPIESLTKPRCVDLDLQQWGRTIRLIPNGSQTLSKCPQRFVEGVYPRQIRRAEGCFVEDLNGKVYTDFVSALGAVILGYSNQKVNFAVKQRIDKGTLFSLPCPDEYALAMSLNHWIPSAEKVKFFKTGSEATSAAIRVARAVTGKDKVVVCGYHGWHDWYQVSNPQNKGIPGISKEYVKKFVYNNFESLRVLFDNDDIAAIIMEPVSFEPPQEHFLESVQEIARAHGALLVFDEVLTGFRMHIGGAQSYFKVVPDLSCFSKAMGNGFPIASLVGKSKYMDIFEDKDFFVSGTFGGDLVGINAALTTIGQLCKDDCFNMKRIWKQGEELKSGFNYIAETLGMDIRCDGYGPRTRFVFPSIEHKALFYQECVKRNKLFGPNNFITVSHSSVVLQSALLVIEEVLSIVKANNDNPKIALEGPVPQEVIIR